MDMKIELRMDDLKNEKAKQLLKNIIGNEEVIFVGIGTMKCILDSLGPRICSKLQNKASVFGTAESPLHALNIPQRVPVLMKENKDKLKIAIDSCICDEDKIGTIFIDSKPVRPGAGMKKELPAVGDYSIKIGVASTVDALFPPYKGETAAIQTKRMQEWATMVANYILECLEEGNENSEDKSEDDEEYIEF